MWIIQRRIKDEKDAIHYSYFNGDLFSVMNAFDSNKENAVEYKTLESAQLDCTLFAEQGYDVSVERSVLL